MIRLADFGQAINVRFARTEVAAFDGVVEKPVNAVAVVLIIFRGVDPALGGDGMRAARRILVTETLHPVTQLAERGRGRSAGQTASDDDDFEFSAIIRINESRMIVMGAPFVGQRSRRDFARPVFRS